MFVLKCNVFHSLDFASHLQTPFFVAYQSQYILQQPGSLKSLVIWRYIYVLGFGSTIRHYGKVQMSKEIHIQQSNNKTSIKTYFMRTYIYVVDCCQIHEWNYIDFTLSEILFTFNQLTRCLKSALTSFFSFLIELLRHNRLVSSAKW